MPCPGKEIRMNKVITIIEKDDIEELARNIYDKMEFDYPDFKKYKDDLINQITECTMAFLVDMDFFCETYIQNDIREKTQ